MPSTESVSHYDLIVCACGDQEYTARDAIEAAIFRGELDATWKKFLHSVAAEKQADELDLDPDESAISGAAEAFRYEHDLITAEETEAWLENRGLTFDDFSDYFSRQYYAGALHDIVPGEVEYASASSELRELFVAELILSGELERMTKELMCSESFLIVMGLSRHNLRIGLRGWGAIRSGSMNCSRSRRHITAAATRWLFRKHASANW